MRAHHDDFRTYGPPRLRDLGCGMTELYDEFALDAYRHLQCELLQHRFGAVPICKQNALGRECHWGRQWQHVYQIENSPRLPCEFGSHGKGRVRAVLLKTCRVNNLLEGHCLSPASWETHDSCQ